MFFSLEFRSSNIAKAKHSESIVVLASVRGIKESVLTWPDPQNSIQPKAFLLTLVLNRILPVCLKIQVWPRNSKFNGGVEETFHVFVHSLQLSTEKVFYC